MMALASDSDCVYTDVLFCGRTILNFML